MVRDNGVVDTRAPSEDSSSNTAIATTATSMAADLSLPAMGLLRVNVPLSIPSSLLSSGSSWEAFLSPGDGGEEGGGGGRSSLGSASSSSYKEPLLRLARARAILRC